MGLGITRKFDTPTTNFTVDSQHSTNHIIWNYALNFSDRKNFPSIGNFVVLERKNTKVK